MENSYFRVYDAIRIYEQERRLFEINTWVEKKEERGFADYKRLNIILISEEQL